MQSEAAAASWHPAQWHVGWHGSHSTPTTVSGEDKWQAWREEEGTARQEAPAPQGGEAEAAALQQILNEQKSSAQAIPQMKENQQNEAREAATKAAAEREAATRAWGEAEAAAFQRVVSEREVGRLLAWPWLQGLVEFLVDMLHVCAAAAVETQQC